MTFTNWKAIVQPCTFGIDHTINLDAFELGGLLCLILL